MSDTVTARLRQVFGRVFGRPFPEFDRETRADQVDGWDSLRHASLIVGIEDHFGIEYPEEKWFEFENVGDIMDVILTRIRPDRAGSTQMRDSETC